jgi:hypothetical protein
MKIRIGDVVTGEQIAALGDVALDGVNATVAGYAFRVCAASEEWVCRSVPETRAQRKARRAREAAEAARQEAMEMARKLGWKDFVCWYVARATAKEPHRGYTVRKSDRGFAIWDCQHPGVPPMLNQDARTVYSWFERLPLVTLSREADAIRFEAFGPRTA